MRNPILLAVLVYFGLSLHTQAQTFASLDGEYPTNATPLVQDLAVDQPIFINAQTELPAAFPEAQGSINEWLELQLEYPEQALDNSREGRVVVRFVVDESGQINELSLVKKIGLGCDEAALTAIENMPAWIPAQINGQAVSVVIYLPIDFRLR